jgi:hypothetical protein
MKQMSSGYFEPRNVRSDVPKLTGALLEIFIAKAPKENGGIGHKRILVYSLQGTVSIHTDRSRDSSVGIVTGRTKLNSVPLVGERTIPTERPSLVGEVSANPCG